MKSARHSLLTAALALSALPLPAFAWSAQGHRLVAEVAAPQLSAPVAAQVSELLAGEAVPTLPGIATWADELRSLDPELARTTGAWHYVNMGEEGCRYVAEQHCPGGNCVVEAFRSQAAVLGDRTQPPAVRTRALKFVVHMVGDLHQPMHAGYAHDRGGNRHQLQFKGRGTNLHAFWDGGMLYARGFNDRKYLKALQALPAPAQPLDFTANSAVQWTEATCRIAISPGVYPKGRILEKSYLEQYRPLAEAQLRLAGDRLAQVLNTVLAAPAAATNHTDAATHDHANHGDATHPAPQDGSAAPAPVLEQRHTH